MPRRKLTRRVRKSRSQAKAGRQQRPPRSQAEAVEAQKRKMARSGKLALVTMPMFIVAGVLFIVRGIMAETFWPSLGLNILGGACLLFGGFFLVSVLRWPPWKEHVANSVIERMKENGKL